MSFGNYPEKYLLYNQKQSKNLSIVLEIDSPEHLFGIADTYTQIRYGDSGIVYGLPGVVYGGLRRLNQVKPYMQLDQGLTIQQRIEPEQGKGNIGTINISLIDYNGEISKLVSPGIVFDEIMNGKLCRLWIGFADTSYPEDYVLLYQGYITQVVCPPGLVKLQISDGTMKKRQPIFDFGTTTLSQSMAATSPASGTIVSVFNTGVLPDQILGPDGTYDPTVSTYMEIDSEIVQIRPTGIIDDTHVLVTRGALGTAVTTHDAGTSVTPSVGFGQNSEGVNGLELALKILLSGSAGPSVTDIDVLSFVYDYQGNFVPNEFVLKTSDAKLDLGLTVGDYFYVTDSASGNDVSGKITGIQTGANGKSSVIVTDQTFNLENPSTALVAFRSQYDTYPETCGVGCTMADVDVSTFQAVRKNYFSSGIANLRSYYNSAVLGKDLVDNDIMLPLGCYSISRYGRISLAVTKPPLPGSGTKLVQLDYTNVLDPEKIQVTRSTNSRSFYNQISYEYDYDVATQTFGAIQYFLDTNSLNEFDYASTLPIQAVSVASALGGAELAQQRGQALLTRFKNCLITIELSVNWTVGSLIEVSDIVLLKDDGNLQIMNFDTGERNIGVGLFEVIDRTYQIVAGNVKLKLLGGLGFSLNSRFGLYSPSSVLDSGSTASTIKITPSYGQTTLVNEIQKWRPLVGMGVVVRSPDWSVTGQSVILQTNPVNPFALDLSPILPFVPPSGYILDIAPYPTDENNSTDSLLKLLYAHYTPTILVTSGASTTQFHVAASGSGLLVEGNSVVLRNADFSTESPESVVLSVVGTLVTLKTSLGFVPNNTFVVEGIGFNDGGGYYRYD